MIQKLLYFFVSLGIQFIFVSSKSLGTRSDQNFNDCRNTYLQLFKTLCTPLPLQTPCYSNTTFNSDTCKLVYFSCRDRTKFLSCPFLVLIEQVREQSLANLADLCCMSMGHCNHVFIASDICCNEKNGNGKCLEQCYGYRPPITAYTWSELGDWEVLKNQREQKPSKDLYDVVFPERS